MVYRSCLASDLIRTRDPAKLDESDIVLDVGGVYDPSKHRYDHHQRGFEEVFSPNRKTKLSSAGLVYKHFGKQLIAQALQEKGEKDDAKVEILYKKLYENFVEALDGIDNGIQQYEGDSKPRYSSRTDLSSRVGHVRARGSIIIDVGLRRRSSQLHPSWNEESNDAELDVRKVVLAPFIRLANMAFPQKRFEVASALAGSEFYGSLNRSAFSWYPARSLVEEAVQSRKKHDASGKLIVFEGYAPWKEHLFLLEEDLSIPEAEKPIYVVYPDESGKWRVQAVPVSPDSFQSRKALPEQ